ncbi:vomeronasal type-1 receptor 1-like [Tachyglossus aculeatus]|uniref:vomeronasal type-1 receptor 1-like n=1 Tax=Tachyglossus aculeatus TaxID=9261 RepID=UPI0018F34CAF|nr:vomeronasal type-1 receptor 1-like [Tachyglossus aculeatus]
MFMSDLVFGIFFLSQTAIGIVGNSIALTMYVRVFLSQPHQKKPTDLILVHLSLTNKVVLLSCGIPEVMVAFGMKNVSDDLGCKMVLYMNRVSRGLSICTSCLLSVFQAVTISPSTSRWAKLKHRGPNCILPSFLFFWVLNMLIYIRVIVANQAIRNVTLSGIVYASKHCFSSAGVNNELSHFYHWASGYMVTVLYRHRKQVQHIRSSSLSPKPSVETRATRTILLLVTCFVGFYWLNCIITLYLTNVVVKDLYLEGIKTFFTACYPTLCPLVLINSDSRFPRPQCSWEKWKSSSPFTDNND